jgi:hypothetical protein
MKKVLAVMFVASLALGAVSCKKDYTCECTITGLPATATPIANSSKSDATDACNALDAQVKLVDASGSCTLK